MGILKVNVLFYLALCISFGLGVREHPYSKYETTPGVTRPLHQTQKQFYLKGYHKTPIKHYANASATFTLSIICCDDVELNPGPFKLTRCSPNKRWKYTRDELVNINTNSSGKSLRFPDRIWKIISELHIGKEFKTRRGCRAGVRKLKHFKHPIPMILPRARTNPPHLIYPRFPRSRCLTSVPVISQSENDLPSFLLSNVRSACNKFDELSAVISHLNVDIAAITETWFRNDCPLENFSIPGYNLFTKSRINRIGGGVAIYVKELLNPSPANIQVPINLEVTWVKIRPASS